MTPLTFVPPSSLFMATAAVAGGLALSSVPVRAQVSPDVVDRIEAMQRDITELKNARASTGATAVTLGGYAKFDLLYSSRSTGVNAAADQLFDPSSIPVGPGAGANERNQLTMHARQSRLFLKTQRPSSWGDIRTHLEFDLFGASGNESVSNSHGLRVRHAYGTIGGLLAGQTWSNFMTPSALPEMLDFGGPVGQTFARQAQLRWTQPFSAGVWSVALENPETVLLRPDASPVRADDDQWPDLTGNLGVKTGFGDFNVAALVRRVRLDSAAPGSVSAKVGKAIGFYGVLPTIGADSLNFGINVGDGMGRYWGGLLPDGFLDANGRVELADQVGGFVSYRHHWSSQWRSTLAFGALRADNPDGAAASASRSFQSAHLNLIWKPAPSVDMGVEYIHGGREVQGGDTGRVNRVQTSLLFAF